MEIKDLGDQLNVVRGQRDVLEAEIDRLKAVIKKMEAVNKQLVEALETIANMPESGSNDLEIKIAKEAIAAAEKEGGVLLGIPSSKPHTVLAYKIGG